MKDKTVVYMVVVFSILIVCGIGYYVGITMVDELESHPEITEIGAPPDLRLLAVIMIVAAIMCGITLKLNPVKENIKDEEAEI